MAINTILQAAAVSILNHTGVDAVYSSFDDFDLDCKVVLAHDVLIQADGYDATVATIGTTITALVSDVGTVKKDETFIIDEVQYKVIRPESNDNIMVTLVVKEWHQ